MSTGDQTEYLRVKIAERGLKEGAKFMKDGFDAWAESERPARAGGVEKMPAEVQMTTRKYGGVRHHMKHINGGRTPAVSSQAYMPGQYEETHGGAHGGAYGGAHGGAYGGAHGGAHGGMLHGGISGQDLINIAQKLYDFYQKALEVSATVKEDLRSPDVPAKYKKTAEQVAKMIESVGLGKPPHQAVAECMQSGMGRHGGASALEFVQKWGAKLVQFYNWFLTNKEGIHYILKMKSINAPPPDNYPQQLEALLTQVGLGKKHGGAACSCNGGRRHGGRHGGDGKQSMNALTEVAYDEPSYGKKRVSKRDMEPLEESTTEYYVPNMDEGESMSSKKVRMDAVKSASKRNMAQDKRLNMRGPPEMGQSGEEGIIIGGRRMGGRSMGNVSRIAKHVAPSLVGQVLGGRRMGGRRMGGRAPSARNLIVKKVMAERGLSLPQASKYVKEHNLY